MDDGVRNKAWESDGNVWNFPSMTQFKEAGRSGSYKIRKYAENNPGRTIFVCRRQQWIIFDTIYLDGEGALSSLGSDLIGQYLRSLWVDLELTFIDTQICSVCMWAYQRNLVFIRLLDIFGW